MNKKGLLYSIICVGILLHGIAFVWFYEPSRRVRETESFSTSQVAEAPVETFSRPSEEQPSRLSLAFAPPSKDLKEQEQELAASFETPHASTAKSIRTLIEAPVFDPFCLRSVQLNSQPHHLQLEYAPSLEMPFPSAKLIAFREEDAPAIGRPAVKYSIKDALSVIFLPNPLKLESPGTCAFSFQDSQSQDALVSNEDFDVQVEYSSKRSRPGYVFKITLTPKEDISHKRITQNFYFLLDRSNSISKTRYNFNKIAVSEALGYLQPGDKFNIILFDDRLTRFVDTAAPASEESIASARQFLDMQGHGSYFAVTNLYTSLGKLFPRQVAQNEVNTALLFSDGDTYLTHEAQRLTIGKWTAQNKGKLNLHTIASGSENNLQLLELLSEFNKGALYYTQADYDVPQQVESLMRAIQNPIGKQIVLTAVAKDKSTSVMLQPKQARVPDLYQNTPFVIYGTINKLSDFVLFLQGKHYDNHFDIKKTISFENAKRGSPNVEREWTQLLVQELYERYFEEGNIGHLEAAKQFLAPLNLPTPLLP